MRLLLPCCAVLLISGCSTGNQSENTIAREATGQDPAQVAQAVLQAYRARDLDALAKLSSKQNAEFFSEMAEQGTSHPRYASIFSGWRMDAVSNWQGEILDVRYANNSTAQASFGQISGDEIAVVTLLWEGDRWTFDDIHSPSPDDFSALSTTRDE